MAHPTAKLVLPPGAERLARVVVALVLAGAASAEPVDIVFGISGGPDRVCYGAGAGDFTCLDVSEDEGATQDVALGDVDGDGLLDAVFANFSGPNRVCLRDADGYFDCADVEPASQNTEEVALGFVDGDPFLDAVFANDFSNTQSMRNRVCLGDGAGGFTCADLSPDEESSESVALGDVNADGFTDAVVANNGRNGVCFGDGGGNFACFGISLDANVSTDVALGYVNADPFLDAVFVNNGARHRVCLGNGAGAFGCFPLADELAAALPSLALGYVNGDPFLDVVIADFGAVAEFENRLCLGDGTGQFQCSDLSPDKAFTQNVALGDVDGDSFLDAVFANDLSPNRLCLGDGTGSFDCSDVSPELNDSRAVALGDVGSVPCRLSLGMSYSDGLLTMDFELGSSVPRTWTVSLSILNATFPILNTPIPAIDPPLAFSDTFPFPSAGTIGGLMTITDARRGITCDVWTTVDTGPLQAEGGTP